MNKRFIPMKRPMKYERSDSFKKRLFEKIVPAYLPAFIALLAFILALINGVFETVSKQQALQKKILEFEIQTFTAEKKSILAERDTLKKQLALFKEENIALVRNSSKLVHQLERSKKSPCIENGFLLTEDGNQILTEDGEPISIETIKKSIKDLNKRLITLDNSVITADDTTITIDQAHY